MPTIIKFTGKPEGSIITRGLDNGVDYIDSFCVDIDNSNNYSIDYLTAILFNYDPVWMRLLLKIRNFLVKPFGLETGFTLERSGIKESVRYNVGDIAVAFHVIDRSKSEIVMAEDDSHLYFRVSVFIQRSPSSKLVRLYLTTVVRFHNIIGKIYFIPVKPFHKIIIRMMLKRLFNSL